MTYNHKEAIKALKLRASRARDLATDLDRYSMHLEDDREVSLETRYTWAINDIENFIRNIGFSELARHTANLSKKD